MDSWDDWDDFLKLTATEYELEGKVREAFIKTFIKENWKNWKKTPEEIAETLKLRTNNPEDSNPLAAYKKRKTEVFKKFHKVIPHEGANKTETLLKWLKEQYLKWREQRKPDPTLMIDWHQVCLDMLESQRRATSNPLMQEEAASFEQKQIYVPLSLVQRTKTDKRDRSECSPEAGMRLYEPQYEEKQRFEHEAFLTQILAQGEGKTNGQQIALIGEPGAGKTTLLQAIAFWILDQNLGFPIWISLADLGRTGKLTDFQTYFEVWLQQAIPPGKLTEEVQQNFYEQINQGRVWLLCDGVDEVATSGGETLAAIASSLRGWIARSRVVLTCRLNVWQADFNALEAFETYRLLDFDYPDQVHQFIDNWFHQERQKGERLKAELASSEQLRLRDLIQNPLRLALLCGTWLSEEGKLPETKAGLYYQFVHKFYRWKPLTFPITLSEQRELNKALGRLALRDINESGSRFRLLESFVSQDLGDPDDENSLFYKALKLSWLNDVGIAAESPIKEKVYAFLHPTFEEYFAAKAVEDWHYFLNHIPQAPNQGNYRIFEPQWKEVILLWLGREDVEKEKKEEFIEALVEFEDRLQGFYYFRAYFLAAEGIAEFQDCLRANEIVEEIIKWGFGEFNIKYCLQETFVHRDIAERAKAILPRTHRLLIVTKLTNLLKSPTEYIRLEAAEILGKVVPGNPDAIATLLNSIHTTSDAGTGIQSVIFLENIIGKESHEATITPLVEIIQNHSEPLICSIAAQALWKIAPEHSLAESPVVIESDLFLKAIRLGQINPRDPELINYLLNVVRSHPQNEKEEFARRRAVELLKYMAPESSEVTQVLINLIHSNPNHTLLLEAVRSLGQIGGNDIEAIQLLIDLSYCSQNWIISMNAAIGLKYTNINYLEVATVLVDLIFNASHEEISLGAVKSLKQILPKYPIQSIILVLKNCLDIYITGQKSFKLHQSCYEILLHCSQTLSYPTFYQAWHHPHLS